jgi:hypothetical protein
VTWRHLLAVLAWLALGGCAVQTAALRSAPPDGLPLKVEWDRVPFFPQTALHCGPAALATVLVAQGHEASPDRLAGEVFLPARGGSLQAEMLAGARRHGLLAVPLPPRLEALLREVAAGQPVVVLLNLGLAIAPRWHYAVVVGYDVAQGEVLLRSGENPRLPMAMRTFEHTWSRSGHWSFVVLPPGRWPLTAEEEAAVDAAIGFERSAPPAEARKAYESGLARWPRSLPMAIGLGTTADASGDKDLAIQVFRRAGELHGSGAAWINLAVVLRERGAREAAVEAAHRALSDPHWAGQARALLAQWASP